MVPVRVLFAELPFPEVPAMMLVEAEERLVLPARSVALALMLKVPLVRLVVSKLQLPLLFATAVPKVLLPLRMPTVLPASAVPVRVSVLPLTFLNPLRIGAVGAVLSNVKAKGLGVEVEVFPATSV
jgi:hypothetical protein